MTTKYTGYRQLLKDAAKERDAARAECEKLRALLRDLRPHVLCGYRAPITGAIDLHDRIDAALKEGK